MKHSANLVNAALILCVLVAAAMAAPIDPRTLDDATFERELERRFQYGPPQPEPAEVQDPREGQAADAAYFTAFPTFDRAYTPATRAEAQRRTQALVAEARNLSHEKFVLRVAEIAALADNAHTAIGENAFRKNTPRLPLRTFLFADGLHVLWANLAFADLLGARIDAIDGKRIDDIYKVIRRYYGGTESRRRVRLIPMLESPALLQAAGLAAERNALTLTGVLANGTPFQRRIEAEERGRAAWVSTTVRTLFPLRPGQIENMVSFLKPSGNVPVYLQSSEKLFTLAPLPRAGLYIGLSHNADADEGPIASFLDAALARIRTERPKFVVLDMRMNGGGDLTTTYAFAHALPGAAAGANIYVLTSPFTFSAAITTVAAVKEQGGGRVKIVGEEAGDRLDFWAEGGSFRLPNAFLTVSYAAGRHTYNTPCTDIETCFWLNDRFPVRVATLKPDIAAPLTFAAYRNNRDPAMEAVLTHE
jgi:hypothetical protein